MDSIQEKIQKLVSDISRKTEERQTRTSLAINAHMNNITERYGSSFATVMKQMLKVRAVSRLYDVTPEDSAAKRYHDIAADSLQLLAEAANLNQESLIMEVEQFHARIRERLGVL